MRSYLIKAAVLSGILLCLHFLVIAFLRGPISAEYWVREAIVIKRYLASRMASPKIIFLGGSSTLFGIDAGRVERELGVPAINYGLHACLHFSVFAGEAELVAKPGDVLVMPIEQGNFDDDSIIWTDCQLRNAIAWGNEYLDALSLRERLRYAYLAGRPWLSLDILSARIGAMISPRAYARRRDAVRPPEEIVARYLSGELRRRIFSYSAFNLSDHGDITLNVGSLYKGPSYVRVVEPMAIFPQTKASLKAFVGEMKGRGVRVIIAHAPYLVDGRPSPNWPRFEARFAADVAEIGAELLDRRDELFFPRSHFYNSHLHLNETGRQVRTERAIADLRRLGIGAKVPDTSPDDPASAAIP